MCRLVSACFARPVCSKIQAKLTNQKVQWNLEEAEFSLCMYCLSEMYNRCILLIFTCRCNSFDLPSPFFCCSLCFKLEMPLSYQRATLYQAMCCKGFYSWPPRFLRQRTARRRRFSFGRYHALRFLLQTTRLVAMFGFIHIVPCVSSQCQPVNVAPE